MKYPHGQREQIVKPTRHEIPGRIQAQIESAYSWFYQMYYPPDK
jgi:sulfotransferase